MSGAGAAKKRQNNGRGSSRNYRPRLFPVQPSAKETSIPDSDVADAESLLQERTKKTEKKQKAKNPPPAKRQVNSTKVRWMAGPAYVQSIAQMRESASALSSLGIKFLRAKAHWPRATEKDFQRHLESGLKVLTASAKEFGLTPVSEIVSLRDLELMSRYLDYIEVSPETASDFTLLQELGRTDKTIILNRHPVMTVQHFLSVVKFLEQGGKCRIILVENGVRGFDPYSDACLDLSMILTLKRETKHQVYVDCSQLIQRVVDVEHFAVAAVAAGADGLLAQLGSGTNVHPETLAPLQLQGIMQRTSALRYTLDALQLHKHHGAD